MNKVKKLKTSPSSSKNAKSHKNKKDKIINKRNENKKESQSTKDLAHFKFKNDFKNGIYLKKKEKKKEFVITGNYVNTDSKLMAKKSKFESLNQKFNKTNKNKNKNLIQSDNNSEDELKKENPEELNVLPYTLALRTDKRNIFQLFKSILFEKLELVNIFISGRRIRIICICEYILSLLFDFFFNALLYSDEIVSQKYHNNGKLDFYVSFLISILSNIITSIVCNIVQYSKGIEERLEQISEIRREYKYLYALNQLLKFLKIKMILFILIEIILVGACFYYIVIFCIVYSKSQLSLLTNYLYSLLEGFIKSLIITAIIVVIRQVAITFKSSYLYNTSKYINENF